MLERRQSKRLEPEERFLIEFRKGNASSFRLGEGKDISRTGVRFATSIPVKKGEPLDITLYFPKQFPNVRNIATTAIVRRVYHPGPTHRYRVACEFQDPQPSVLQAVTNFMEWSLTVPS